MKASKKQIIKEIVKSIRAWEDIHINTEQGADNSSKAWKGLRSLVIPDKKIKDSVYQSGHNWEYVGNA